MSSAGDEERTAIVVGAGIVGVCSAWHLQRKGFRVVMVDRKAPGEETSWGNLGLIQHLPPSAFPRSYAARAKALFNQTNDVRVAPSGLLTHWSAVLQYWWNSRPSLFARITDEYVSLVKYCTDEHEVMLREAKASHLVHKTGFYEVTAERSVAELAATVQRMHAAGVACEALPASVLEAREPAITPGFFKSAMYFKDTWCVTNPGALVKAYAAHFVARGGTVVQATVQSLEPPTDATGGRWVVHTDGGDLSAANVVLAAGPWSGELAAKLGYHIPLYPLRGYNTHFATRPGAPPLTTALIEIDNGIGVSPMEMGIRTTTGGELARRDAAINPNQLECDIGVVRQFLPLGEQVTGTWVGSRPCLPDMKPAIGPAPRHKGLYMNFGHGGNGLTLSAVSGRVLSEMMSGETPFVNPAPFAPSRFL